MDAGGGGGATQYSLELWLDGLVDGWVSGRVGKLHGRRAGIEVSGRFGRAVDDGLVGGWFSLVWVGKWLVGWLVGQLVGMVS